MELKQVIEAILFAAGRPVEVGEILAILENAPIRIPGRRPEIEEALELLTTEWEQRGGAIRIEQVAGGYEFRTHSEAAAWVALLNPAKPQRLSTPAVETLALIAYRQPITRAEIESLRGVDSAGVLKSLLERHLLRVVGRKEEAGRPLLYATSREFLELFGLKDLNDLPPLSELEEKIQQVAETVQEIRMDDLMQDPVDLANLEESDREVLGDLEQKLDQLKAVEKEIVQSTEEAPLDNKPPAS